MSVAMCHDDHLAVAQPAEIYGLAVLLIANLHAERHEHAADLLVGECCRLQRLLHIEDLSAEGEYRLELAIAPLLGRATCRIALHQEELGAHGVLLGAVCQLAG